LTTGPWTDLQSQTESYSIMLFFFLQVFLGCIF